MDRRKLLKGMGIGAGMAAAGYFVPAVVADKMAPLSPEVDDPRGASFWENDAGVFPETEKLNSDIKVDVAVIGSGITGLSAAWTLKELDPGIKVCVLDSHRPSSGASSRNSSHLRGEYHSWKSILKSQGPDAAKEWNAFAKRGMEGAVDFINSNRIYCGVRREAIMWVGVKGQEKELEKIHAGMHESGLGGMLYMDKAFQRNSKIKYYVGAIEDNNNYILHPGRLMKGFIEKVLGAGIPIYSNSPVLSVSNTDSKSERNILNTPKGKVTARQVLFATNAYTPRLDGLLSSKMIPVIVATIATEPMSKSHKRAARFLWSHLTEIQLLSRTIGHTPDDRIFFRGILGYSSFNSCVWENPEAGYKRLEKEMRERVPWAEGLKVTHGWTGAVAMTYSSNPIAGPLEKKGQYVCAGYNGTGNVHGFYQGMLVANQMLGAYHPDMKYLRGPSGWIPPEPHRSIGAKTFLFFGI
jgi:glycine/D-amino acid oxidase-like deaminating enzyme